MQYHYNGNIRLNLPGGNAEAGETIANTLQRELMEELRLPIMVGELLLVGETILPSKTTLHLLFAANALHPNDEPQLNPTESTASACLWLPLADLPHAPLYPQVGEPLYALLQQTLTPHLPVYVGQISQHWF